MPPVWLRRLFPDRRPAPSFRCSTKRGRARRLRLECLDRRDLPSIGYAFTDIFLATPIVGSTGAGTDTI